jgi:DNA-binding protein YbaB
MAEPEKSPREVAEVVESAMREFNEAMKLREALSIRIGRRTTQIIRFSLIGMVLLMALMFHLILTLTSNMNDITKRMNSMAVYMDNMSKNFTSVADNVKAMRFSVDGMQEHIQVMGTMNLAMVSMKDSMLKMSGDMKNMNDNMAAMQKSMGRMSMDMGNMSYQFTSLTGYVGVMEQNVDRMASPMRMMPFR